MKQINKETGVCFFRVEQACELTAFLQSRDPSPLPLTIDQATIDHWLEMGCVYVDGLRTRSNVALTPDQILRLHTRPKSFLATHGRLHEQIAFDHPEFLVLDKPAGLPTHPTLDNYVQNAKIQLERELGQTLYVTHRLDVPTQGLLLIAKNPSAQRVLNRTFSLGRVEKLYHSLNPRACALGLHVHYMDPQSRVPKVLSSDFQEGWWKCQLQVEQVTESATGFAHRVRLLTGKTHQIRAQMQALGSPIFGDPFYGEEKEPVREQLALECFELSFTFRSATYRITRPKSIAAPLLAFSGKYKVR
jgi:23S rRNA pseudouridine1911/1915/1917 synthase